MAHVLRNADIAALVHRSVRTVGCDVAAVLATLSVDSRRAAVERFTREGQLLGWVRRSAQSQWAVRRSPPTTPQARERPGSAEQYRQSHRAIWASLPSRGLVGIGILRVMPALVLPLASK